MTNLLVQINPHFVSVQAAKIWLDQCMQLNEIRRVRMVAASFEREMQEAGVIKIYAERRLGEILGETLAGSGRPSKEMVANYHYFHLDDMGISKTESSYFQTLASMPPEALEEALEKYNADKHVPKASGIARRWRAEQKAKALRQAAVYMSVSPDGSLFTNSMPMLLDQIARGEREPFGCIYADPPWQYNNTGTRGAAKNHYPTMALDEIKALPVKNLVADRALLWLWVTDAFMKASFDIIEAWGFEFKAHFVWHKNVFGTGNYLRRSTELMLLCSRGGQVTLTTDQDNYLYAKRAQHSAKPEAVRAIVERNSPGPRLELFGRARQSEWTVFGNEDSHSRSCPMNSIRPMSEASLSG